MYSIEYIAESLRAARKKKGLSQKALSMKVGIPQSHISKIEHGHVDLQISSLIELARVLDLEFMLVPRELLPVFKALQRQGQNEEEEQIPLYRLDEEEIE